MDRTGTKILVTVTAKSGENPDRRRGQVSSAMIVSRGLVGPKTYRNPSTPNGKQVNIPVPLDNETDTHGQVEQRRRAAQAQNKVESRYGEKPRNV